VRDAGRTREPRVDPGEREATVATPHEHRSLQAAGRHPKPQEFGLHEQCRSNRRARLFSATIQTLSAGPKRRY